jgi:hypothetical protein
MFSSTKTVSRSSRPVAIGSTSPAGALYLPPAEGMIGEAPQMRLVDRPALPPRGARP